MEKKYIRDSNGRFIKGNKSCGMLGKKHSDTTKEIISEKKKGIHSSPETEFKKGIHISPQTEFKKGQKPWCAGTKGLVTAWNKGKKCPELSGENNGFWFGGLSKEKYDKRKIIDVLRKSVRQRDDYTCMICGLNQNENDKSLDTHHINYNKYLNIKENLITLCSHCHSKTNMNREHWTKFFQSLLSEKYGYNYDSEGEIVLNILKEVK